MNTLIHTSVGRRSSLQRRHRIHQPYILLSQWLLQHMALLKIVFGPF